MADELKGQVAIVTGGRRGFGQAIALRLAADVNSQADWERVVKETEAQLGPGTLLVANAALSDR